MDFIFLLFSILMINYLINSHIVFLAVTKKISKDFTDSILMRFLATIWSIICCFKLERNGSKVTPAFGQQGGGKEYMTTDIVEVEVINVQPY